MATDVPVVVPVVVLVVLPLVLHKVLPVVLPLVLHKVLPVVLPLVLHEVMPVVLLVVPLVVLPVVLSVTSSSQSSHDYCIQSQTIGVCSQGGLLKKNTVSPLKIERHRRTVPKTSSSQSSHDYCIQSQTIAVNRQDGSPSKKILTPLKVTWERRTNPKTFSSLSFDDDLIQSETVGLENQDCSLSKGTASPLKIKWHQRTMESAITTSEQVWNEAGLQDNVADSWGSPSPKRKRGTMAFTVSPLSDKDNQNEVNSFCHDKSIDDLFASPSPQKDRNRRPHTEQILEENLIDDPAGSPTMQGFQAVQLLDTEVNGGVLPYKTVAQNNAQSLKRWLQCRGYPCYGKKDELVERVGLVMAKGNYHILDPKVDKGIWYNQKVADLQKNNVSSQPFTQEDLEPPSDQWHTFPSLPIPPLFNFGHIIYYLIETCPTLPYEDDSEEDCVHDEPEVLPDPFDDEHKTINEVKMLRKGLMFFKSKHVRALQDCSQGRCYFLKASVRASMEKEAYTVTVALSHRSGSIHVCTCECIQQSLGRCVHVSSVLLALWSHIRLNGNGELETKESIYHFMKRNGDAVLQWQISPHFTIVLPTLYMN
ncbi:hypothetical protein FOCC_FOCC017355 [Frankliniella occidentalis]|nr:hypothetical protein FOCC_FOCC017355 [Frankliniella occidentalis]